MIGMIIGFVTSFLPQILKLWTDWQDKKHELAILNIQREMQAAGAAARLEEIRTQGDISEIVALHQSDTTLSGVLWVDGLKQAIRPVITLWFFALFTAVKGAELWFFLDATGGDLVVSLAHIWDPATTDMFGSVMGFWFGSRVQGRKSA